MASAALLALALVGGCESVSSLGDLTPPLEDDSRLARDVAAALDARPELVNARIHVKSLDADTVRLSGQVDNDRQREVAERVANDVPGVASVVNTLFTDL